eukprot:gb/GFBE01016661.1/.p1 GENE.gb/GFBE01016661.1/~~gb/GFBE01016661.1/.p1  ORF type:complete len:186 (+),score=31.89 gb/GFBE01016661.1/:1-558(+)
MLRHVRMLRTCNAHGRVPAPLGRCSNRLRHFSWGPRRTSDHSTDQPCKEELSKEFAAGAMGIAIWIGLLFYSNDVKSGTHEITVQELAKEYLSKGYVDTMQIVNRSVCLARVRGGWALDAGLRVVSVQLDTLPKFERKIEELQEQLGTASADLVPIQYVNHGDYTGKALLSMIVLVPFVLAASAL